MIETSIEFPDQDVKELMRQMDRARRILNKDISGSVFMAMKYVMQSLSKSTRISQKYRAYTDTGRISRSGLNHIYAVATKYRTPRRYGKSLRRSWQGDWREQLIYAKNERELRQRPAVIIAMRGLAKESWRAGGARNKMNMPRSGDTSSARNKSIMQKAARRWIDTDSRLTGEDPFMSVKNNLKYITDAIEGGDQAVSSSLERAAKSMAHSIENQAAARFA